MIAISKPNLLYKDSIHPPICGSSLVGGSTWYYYERKWYKQRSTSRFDGETPLLIKMGRRLDSDQSGRWEDLLVNFVIYKPDEWRLNITGRFIVYCCDRWRIQMSSGDLFTIWTLLASIGKYHELGVLELMSIKGCRRGFPILIVYLKQKLVSRAKRA